MTKKLYSDSNFDDIADAIRDKNGSSDTYTTADMGDAIRDIPTGDYTVTNGVIKSFKAFSSTISADTFVEFVNNSLADGIKTHEDTSLLSNTAVYPRAFKLSRNKVLLLYHESTYLYGIVCTISGTDITKGQSVLVATVSTDYQISTSAAVLAEDKFFVFYKSDSFRGIVCTISGTAITVGTSTAIESSSATAKSSSVVALDSSTVFVSYVQVAGGLRGIVCTISGTTITAGSPTTITSVGSTTNPDSFSALISENKVFVAYHYGSGYLYGIVCTISGTTITAGTGTRIDRISVGKNFTSIVALAEDKVFIASQPGALFGVVCTISGTTITVGTVTYIISYSCPSPQYAFTVMIDENTVFIVYKFPASTTYLYGIVCTISGTTITAGTGTRLSSILGAVEYASAVALTQTKVFALHQKEEILYGLIVESAPTIQASTSKIEGLTAGECTTSTAGDVWVLDTDVSS